MSTVTRVLSVVGFDVNPWGPLTELVVDSHDPPELDFMLGCLGAGACLLGGFARSRCRVDVFGQLGRGARRRVIRSRGRGLGGRLSLTRGLTAALTLALAKPLAAPTLLVTLTFGFPAEALATNHLRDLGDQRSQQQRREQALVPALAVQQVGNRVRGHGADLDGDEDSHRGTRAGQSKPADQSRAGG